MGGKRRPARVVCVIELNPGVYIVGELEDGFACTPDIDGARRFEFEQALDLLRCESHGFPEIEVHWEITRQPVDA